ncbi:glycosyltransferase family 2 protein [Aeromonas veronii]|uniref:glycosyltransferase family 2 protein n=1 Tax=Aeromonas veronii TaxID=654 RepID=UPI003BA339E7
MSFHNLVESSNVPLVTIVIPNYNNGKYLPGCLKELSKQTYNYIEIIVVDDCSTDDSVYILEDLKKHYHNLKVYKNEINRGVSYSRNFGVSVSSGEYITTLDPDDVFYHDKIEKEIATINSLSKKGLQDIIAYSGFNSVDDDMNNIPFKSRLSKNNAVNGWVFKRILYMSSPVPRDMLFTKKQFYTVGGFNETMSLYEDWEFKLRLARTYQFYFSGSPGVKYRRHKKGLSSVDFSIHQKIMGDIFTSYNKTKGGYLLFKLINGKGFLSKGIKFLLYFPVFSVFFKD